LIAHHQGGEAAAASNFAVVQCGPRDRGYSRHSTRLSGSIVHQLARRSLGEGGRPG